MLIQRLGLPVDDQQRLKQTIAPQDAEIVGQEHWLITGRDASVCSYEKTERFVRVLRLHVENVRHHPSARQAAQVLPKTARSINTGHCEQCGARGCACADDGIWQQHPATSPLLSAAGGWRRESGVSHCAESRPCEAGDTSAVRNAGVDVGMLPAANHSRGRPPGRGGYDDPDRVFAACPRRGLLAAVVCPASEQE
jgi:hypothetical protein